MLHTFSVSSLDVLIPSSFPCCDAGMIKVHGGMKFIHLDDSIKIEINSKELSIIAIGRILGETSGPVFIWKVAGAVLYNFWRLDWTALAVSCSPCS